MFNYFFHINILYFYIETCNIPIKIQLIFYLIEMLMYNICNIVS